MNKGMGVEGRGGKTDGMDGRDKTWPSDILYVYSKPDLSIYLSNACVVV